MSRLKSFFHCWLFVCWLPIVGAIVGIGVQSLRITSKPQRFVSLAKVLAQPRSNAKADSRSYKLTYINDFYGTTIETLEHAEMRRRALNRVKALNPDLKETDVEISASRNKDSAIINIRAYGTEPKYTRAFLDALLDEFMAFRSQIQEQQRNKELVTLAEDVVRREKSLLEKLEKLTAFQKENHPELLRGELNRITQRLPTLRNERDDLNRKKRGGSASDGTDKQLAAVSEELAKTETQAGELSAKNAALDALTKDYEDAKHAYDEILDVVRRLPVYEQAASDTVNIMERASGAVEDIQDWVLPISIGAIGGGLAGLALSLLIAAFIHTTSHRADPPPLPPSS